MLIYTLINFLLLAALLWLFGRKAVARLFQARSQQIAQGLAAAQGAQDNAPAQLEAQQALETEQALRLAAQQKEAQAQLQVGLAQQESEFQQEKAQREAAAADGLANARRGMIKRAKRRALNLIAENAPQMLRIPPDYDRRVAGRIAQMLSPTRAEAVSLQTNHALQVEAVAANPLPQAIVQQLSDAVRAAYPGADWPQAYQIPVRVDETLLGGLKLRVQDTVYDGSVRNLLDVVASGAIISTPQAGDGLPQMLQAMQRAFENLQTDVEVYQVGRVESVSDGICTVSGLADALYGELVLFPEGVKGMVMNLERDRVGCVIFGEFERIDEGEQVRRTGHVIEVPVGEALLGRVVDSLGTPVDGLGDILNTQTYPAENPAPGIVERKGVSVPLYTGIKAVDALVPIGRGQRELIIGDRQTGKSALAVDAIINQRGKNVLCIYVAIGQKETTVAAITEVLRRYGAMEYTVIVLADAFSSAPMQYIAPYTGTAMGEYFMRSGRDVLIVYDDLSKHAVAYRELSLLLHRPSGREAYPGDVFYLHSRLLERSARLTPQAGGGSMTALPIIETQEGDISAYIPTNAISITDGQIFLESELFNEGQRPAVNIGLSVSRVGGSAQSGPMRQVAGRLRMDLAQYRELASFSQFGSDLDAATKASLARGDRMTAALKQSQFVPLNVENQVLILQAVTMGFADDIAPSQIPQFEAQLAAEFAKRYPQLLERLARREKLNAEELARLSEAIGQTKGALA